MAISEAHCTTCCEHFGSDSAFDFHRISFECLPVERFSEPRSEKNNKPRLVSIEKPQGRLWVRERREALSQVS